MSASDESYILKLNPPKELENLLVKRINADIENKTFYAFDEVGDELSYIFGEDWREQFKQLTNEHKPFFGEITPDVYYSIMVRGIVLNLMIAKRGYVRNDGCHSSCPGRPQSGCPQNESERAYSVIKNEIHKRHPELPPSFFAESDEEHKARLEEIHEDAIWKAIGIGVTFVTMLFTICGVGAFWVILWLGIGYVVCLLVTYIIDAIEKRRFNRKRSVSDKAFIAFLMEIALSVVTSVLLVIGCNI